MTLYKRKIIYVLLIVSFSLLLAGCGHVKSAKKLIREAKRAHGACDVVSKEESKECTEVRLRDKLQGFEYSMVSSMQDIVIDGSSFGSLPNTYDSFESSLNTFVKESAKEKLDEISENYGATYDEMYVDEVIMCYTLKNGMPDSNAVCIAQEAAAALQEYNVGGRLDGRAVYVDHDAAWVKEKSEKNKEKGREDDQVQEPYVWTPDRHIGSALLPDCTFRDPEKEKEDYYLEMARMKDSKAVYLRKEKKSLKELGLSVMDVTPEYGSEGPKKDTDKVTVYYFEAGGQEFYICDVLYYDSSGWVTDYKDPDSEKYLPVFLKNNGL